VAKTRNNMGIMYDSQGRYEEALEAYSKSLDIKIKVLGQDSLEVAKTHNNMAKTHNNIETLNWLNSAKSKLP